MSREETQPEPMADVIKRCVKDELTSIEGRLIELINAAKGEAQEEVVEVEADKVVPAETYPMRTDAGGPSASPAVAPADPWQPTAPAAATAPAKWNEGDSNLAPLDAKVIKKPSEYAGDIKGYMDWHESLVNFLASKDNRWRKVMAGIEEKGFKAIELEDEVSIAREAGLPGQLGTFKNQLYTYLQSFTKGSTLDLVTAGQETKSSKSSGRSPTRDAQEGPSTS